MKHLPSSYSPEAMQHTFALEFHDHFHRAASTPQETKPVFTTRRKCQQNHH